MASSFRSEAARSVGAILGALVAAGLLAAPARAAREARGKHESGTIVWQDEQGRSRSTEGRRVRFGWYERRQLAVPRDGRTFVDEERQARGVPLAGRFVAFGRVRSVGFAWEPPPEGGEPRLVIQMEMMGGGTQTASGFDLQGIQHPRPPYVSFVGSDGAERRIEVPLRPPPEGGPTTPRMERIVFDN